jgi:hypothetical protein
MTDDPEIPEDPPTGPSGGTTETPDEPLGVPADGESDEVGDQPGIPKGEPPASE